MGNMTSASALSRGGRDTSAHTGSAAGRAIRTPRRGSISLVATPSHKPCSLLPRSTAWSPDRTGAYALHVTPKRFPDTVPIAKVRVETEGLDSGTESGDRRRVAGRVLGRREMGKLVFLDLVDRSGRIQLLCDTSRTGQIDVDLRYRNRYLDLLMNEDSRHDALVRTKMVTAIRAYLDGEGFLEVETPILQPQYGGAFAEPFVTHSNYLDQDEY